MELMTNEINENNYKQEISKSEDKLNKFLEESNLKFNNTLNEIYSNLSLISWLSSIFHEICRG